MALRRNLLIIILLSLLCLLGVLYLVTSTVMLSGFSNVERTTTAGDTTRVKDALTNQISDLDRRINDWANWDDSWLYVNGEEPDFPSSNMENIALKNLDINFMLYADAKGQLLPSKKAIDLDKEDPDTANIAIPPDFAAKLGPDSPFFKHKDENDKQTGILNLADKPVLLAVRPQLHSDGSGPIAGTIIFGRFLDKTQIGSLSELTHITDMTFTSLKQTPTGDAAKAVTELKKTGQTVVHPLGDKVKGYALINDIFGQPALLLTITTPRDVYQQGTNSLLYFIIATAVVGLLFAIVVFLMLESLIMRPVNTLLQSTLVAANQHNYANRLPVNGKGEMAELTSAFNKILDELQFSQQSRAELDRLRKLSAEQDPHPPQGGEA